MKRAAIVKTVARRKGEPMLRRGETPEAVKKIRSRRAWLIGLRIRYHLAPDWEARYERDYGRRARAHLIPRWQLLPYCDA